jgi:hypothetical protein
LPLAGLIWANITDEADRKGSGNSTKMSDRMGHRTSNGDRTGAKLNATAVAEAEKNATLVAMCEAWVTDMTQGNMSETDAGK